MFQDLTTLVLGIVMGAALIGAAVFAIDDARATQQDDAPAIANCIAEYDYKHPKGTRFGNLVAGIRHCNLVEDGRSRECVAPCVVTFGKGMREDMFCIDYRGNGTLRVWRDNDTEC